MIPQVLKEARTRDGVAAGYERQQEGRHRDGLFLQAGWQWLKGQAGAGGFRGTIADMSATSQGKGDAVGNLVDWARQRRRSRAKA